MYFAEELPDSSGKPAAEGFVRMLCGEDLQRIAGTPAGIFLKMKANKKLLLK